jgi:transketolase
VRRADIEQAVPQIAAHKGPVYMRLLRGNVPLVLDEYDYKFELGKAKLLRDGNDVLVISSGFMTMRALEVGAVAAGGQHRRRGAALPTIKPLDEAAIVEAVRYRHRLVVVAENHSVIGGLGEAVASALLRHRVQPAGFQLAGLPDAFLDAGALPTLHDRYGISREALAPASRAGSADRCPDLQPPSFINGVQTCFSQTKWPSSPAVPASTAWASPPPA